MADTPLMWCIGEHFPLCFDESLVINSSDNLGSSPQRRYQYPGSYGTRICLRQYRAGNYLVVYSDIEVEGIGKEVLIIVL